MAEKVEHSQEKELLRSALEEIRVLRMHNNLMSARLDMFDRIDRMINANLPQKGGEYHGPDVCYEIEKFLKSEGDGVKAAG